MLYLGDSRDIIKSIPSNSVDLILTDPPYELGSFRKKIGQWEKEEITSSDIFKECNRVLKDGGHLICFTANRTIHKFGQAIENAGFEIRDTLIWQYPQSIPRNMNIAKAIDSHLIYGKTSSKYLKMIEQEYGGESYKIKGTNNTMFGEKVEFERKVYTPITDKAKEWKGWGTNLAPSFEPMIMARKKFKGSLAENVINNNNGALNIEELSKVNGKFPSNILYFEKEKRDDFNNHPMVKPIKLLEYIIKMTTTDGAVILDPFMGSGSTCVAVSNIPNRAYIGIEREVDYYNIAKKRLGITNKNVDCDNVLS